MKLIDVIRLAVAGLDRDEPNVPAVLALLIDLLKQLEVTDAQVP